jgi:hypothetical protein
MLLHEIKLLLTPSELQEMSHTQGIGEIISSIVPNGPITKIRAVADTKVNELIPFLRRWAIDNANMMNKGDQHMQLMIQKIMNNSQAVAKQIVDNYIVKCLK